MPITKGNSPAVHSRQQAPHPRLPWTLSRHLARPWRQPLHGPSVAAFESLHYLLRPGDSQRLVLDSGCGTGTSTRMLAARHPGAVVIGVDRSARRLRAVGAGGQARREGNVIWVRAELASFWRLALDAGWRLDAHYLLHPNPWPKARHLGRRWHAHPVFPCLLALGGDLSMHCNWAVYAEEFAFAVRQVTKRPCRPRRLAGVTPLSPFEAKYLASGHPLYEARARLG